MEVYLMWRNVVKVSERVMWRRLIVEDFLLSRHVDKYTLKELCGGRFLSWLHVEVVFLWSYVDMVVVKE